MQLRIGSIVIDCHQFDRMVDFWQKALGYVPRWPHTPSLFGLPGN
jgi:hypothetical protein